MAYVPHSDADIRAMLETVGARSVAELFAAIPPELHLGHPLDVPEAAPEADVVQHVGALGARNAALVCFAGGGIYEHYVPSAVNHILLRSEWYTAYTPYQPEVSQGSLQLVYEFQTMIADLFGMDVANASMYDAATAAGEAALMAHAVRHDRAGIVVAHTVHPHVRRVIQTVSAGYEHPYAMAPFGSDGRLALAACRDALQQAACLLVQQPNFLGVIEDLRPLADAAHDAGALLIVLADPIAMGILRSPGSAGADIVVGEGQSLGTAMALGGPGLGLFAAKRDYLRQMPGRIVGATVDRQERRGFVLTLQAREQQIRREKATSNICTNQALMALAATVYLALLGREGFRQTAARSLENAHRAFDAVMALPGYEPLVDGPFFKEFAVRTPRPAREIIARGVREGVLAGIALDRFPDRFTDDDALLIAVTDKRTDEDIDRLVAVLRS